MYTQLVTIQVAQSDQVEYPQPEQLRARLKSYQLKV